MRKLFLISAFVLASASAQASDIGSLIPAGNDTPAAASTAAPAASRKRASSSSKKSQASRSETDEQKARQIAAPYCITW
jgi:ribosomal protein L12E/L44/L45/RPP1/RPP2